MKLPPLTPGVFRRRVNRFRVEVTVDGQVTSAHLPNSGRLHEVLHPGAPVYLRPVDKPGRKTPYDLALIAAGEVWVSIDARLPPRLLAEAIRAGRLDDWWGAPGATWQIRAEPSPGEGRLDLHLQSPHGTWWLETKSITLVEHGVALFPDAPTVRGRRHLATLCDLVRQGQRAAVVFVVQRPDAERFAPHPHADPDFPKALQEAAACGVVVRAYTCEVTPQEIRLAHAIPVALQPPTRT